MVMRIPERLMMTSETAKASQLGEIVLVCVCTWASNNLAAAYECTCLVVQTHVWVQ